MYFTRTVLKIVGTVTFTCVRLSACQGFPDTNPFGLGGQVLEDCRAPWLAGQQVHIPAPSMFHRDLIHKGCNVSFLGKFETISDLQILLDTSLMILFPPNFYEAFLHLMEYQIVPFMTK